MRFDLSTWERAEIARELLRLFALETFRAPVFAHSGHWVDLLARARSRSRWRGVLRRHHPPPDRRGAGWRRFRERVSRGQHAGLDLEVFAAGLPVVSAASGGIPHLVEHERTGLRSGGGEVSALARNVRRVIADQALAHRLARNGHDESSRYEWMEEAAGYRSMPG